MRTSILVFACLFAGCVRTQVHRLDETVRPVRSPEAVAVLTEVPARPYVVIAVLESESGTAFDSFDDMRKEMVARAAELGGDALILDPGVTEESFLLTGTAMIRSEKRRLRCQVIAYDGAVPRPAGLIDE